MFSKASSGRLLDFNNNVMILWWSVSGVANKWIPLFMFSLDAISAFFITPSITHSVSHDEHRTVALELFGIFNGAPQLLHRKSFIVTFCGIGDASFATAACVSMFSFDFLPQTEQNTAPSWSLPPQPEQNIYTS